MEERNTAPHLQVDGVRQFFGTISISITSSTGNMLGTHVISDLELATVSIPTQLPWGLQTFQQTLQSPTADIVALKRRQLALFALRHKEAEASCKTLRESMAAVQTAPVDELEAPVDPRIQESVEQIYWSPKTTFGALLNPLKYVVAFLVFWKTLVLPTIAVVAPILAIVVPFFLIRFLHGAPVSPTQYLDQLRTVLLKQISIPNVLRAKHSGDVMGHMLESGFLLLTGATYLSGIWSQVTSSLHLRTIAMELREKGVAIQAAMGRFSGMLDTLCSLPKRLQSAIRPFLLRGERIRADLAAIPRDCGFRTYGFLWNQRDALMGMKTWLGELDAMLGIVEIPDITFPRYVKDGSLAIEHVYHPALKSRITNTVTWQQSQSQSHSHSILTGPNRGGKSTLCRAVGISLLCAQTWGFAFARRMSLEPFHRIETALHPADTLGELSLFEAEIEFAKTVLEHGRAGRTFVMMDEIFHSTNAGDGLAASRVFLRQLFDLEGVTSLISTHYKELPAEFAGVAQAWAMDAHETAEGLLSYTYRMIQGISDKSSVMEILRERGLIAENTSAPPIRGPT